MAVGIASFFIAGLNMKTVASVIIQIKYFSLYFRSPSYAGETFISLPMDIVCTLQTRELKYSMLPNPTTGT